MENGANLGVEVMQEFGQNLILIFNQADEPRDRFHCLLHSGDKLAGDI